MKPHQGYYYVFGSAGDCGHTHRGLTKELALCARGRGRGPGRVYFVAETNTSGSGRPASAAELASLAAFLPSRGRGRPAGQTPLVEQARPLQLRLSVPERQRYERAGAALGLPDLNDFVRYLLDSAANSHDVAAIASSPLETPKS